MPTVVYIFLLNTDIPYGADSRLSCLFYRYVQNNAMCINGGILIRQRRLTRPRRVRVRFTAIWGRKGEYRGNRGATRACLRQICRSGAWFAVNLPLWGAVCGDIGAVGAGLRRGYVLLGAHDCAIPRTVTGFSTSFWSIPRLISKKFTRSSGIVVFSTAIYILATPPACTAYRKIETTNAKY